MTKQSMALNILAQRYPSVVPSQGESGYNMIQVDREHAPRLFEDISSIILTGFSPSVIEKCDYIEIRFTSQSIQLYTGRYIPDSDGVANVQTVYEAKFADETNDQK